MIQNLCQTPDVTELIPAQVIAKRVAELASQISTDYDGKQLYIVGVLNGAFVFAADLVRRLTIPVYVDFVGVSSYRHGSVRSAARITKQVKFNLTGRHVLIVDDIFDSGNSLSVLSAKISELVPASLQSCVLLARESGKEHHSMVKYRGFDIGDQFVVGYGLDHAEQYRQLPFVGYLSGTGAIECWEPFIPSE